MTPYDPNAKFRIFLSRVSSEFEKAATGVASDLRARGLEVKIQEDFRQESDTETTLDKLHKYIRDCSAVVAIIGQRSGGYPPDAAAQKYVHLLPAGITRASYTQWEIHFARHYGRRLSFYDGRTFTDYARAAGTGDDEAHQREYVTWLFSQNGLDRDAFSTEDKLARHVLREEWPLYKPHQPRKLPYNTLGHLFKGREEFMDRLRAALRGGARAAGINATHAIAATHGLGGIGKTRLAVEYALRHAGEYEALLCISADTPEKLDASLAALTGPLVLNLPEQSVPDPQAQQAAVLRWLAAHPRFFLIIDNVDDDLAADAARALIARLPDGHIVLTGRIDRWPRGVEALELSVLAPADAASFILDATAQRRPAADDSAQALVIAEKLGGLALALEQAAGYINEQRADFAEYLRDWEQRHDTVLEWFDEAVSGYPKSVAVTWETSFAKLPPGAARLLELFAWFAPDPIPVALLEGQATTIMNAVHSPAVDRDVLTALTRYGLATREKARPFLVIHRLVQDVTRRRLEKEGRGSTMRGQSAEWMANVFSGNAHFVSEWSRLDPLAPHALTLAKLAAAHRLQFLAGRLYWGLGLWTASHGRFEEAIQQDRRAVEHLQAALGPEHPYVLTNRSNLAGDLNSQGQYAEAEAEHRMLVEVQQRVLGKEHPDTLGNRSNLAMTLLAQGQHSAAEAEHRAVLIIRQRVLGLEHRETLESRNCLATSLGEQGKYAEAEAEHRAVLKIRERVLGREHPDTLQSRNNLANELLMQKKHGEAEEHHRETLQTMQRVLGAEHPETLTSRSNLANVLQVQGKHAEAEAEHRAALKLRQQALGREHPDVFLSYFNLSLCLEAQDQKPEALKFARQAFQGWRRTIGESHPWTLAAQKQVANLEGAV